MADTPEHQTAAWRCIQDAPPLDQPLLLYCPGLNDWRRPTCLPNILVGAWDGGYWVSDVAEIEGYESTGDYIVHPPVHPTHWMPLPEPPHAE